MLTAIGQYQAAVEYYHTPGEAIGMVILIIMGYCIWLAISTFSRGPAGAPGYQDDDGSDDSPAIPDPPLASGLIGCSPVAWFMLIILLVSFMCWYTTTPYRP